MTLHLHFVAVKLSYRSSYLLLLYPHPCCKLLNLAFMAPLHSTPRPPRAASLSSSFSFEKLCFCTEELGSESISNLSITPSSPTHVVDASAHAGPRRRSTGFQGLHGSLQKEASDHDYLSVSNISAKCRLQEARGLREVAPMDDASNDAISSSLQCTNLSLQKYATTQVAAGAAARAARMFPPPISSLVSDRQIMRTCKFDGRFVLQRVSSISNSPFCAIRENGRLKLIAAYDAHPEEEVASEEEDKQRESTIIAHKNFGVKESSAAYSMCVPICRSQIKLLGPWETAIFDDYYLPALRLLLLTAAGTGAQNAHCRPRRRRSRMDSTSLTITGKREPEDKSSSSQGINTSIEESHIIKSKAALEAYRKQGYAIISMKIGLLILVLEISSKGTLVLQAKGVFFPSAMSSNFAFNFIKPLDLRLEPTCHSHS